TLRIPAVHAIASELTLEIHIVSLHRRRVTADLVFGLTPEVSFLDFLELFPFPVGETQRSDGVTLRGDRVDPLEAYIVMLDGGEGGVRSATRVAGRSRKIGCQQDRDSSTVLRIKSPRLPLEVIKKQQGARLRQPWHRMRLVNIPQRETRDKPKLG